MESTTPAGTGERQTGFGARFVLVALVAYVGVSVLSATQSGIRDPSRGWGDLFAGTLMAWLPWLFFSVPIVRLSRSTWGEGRRLMFLAANAVTGASCSALYMAYLAAFRTLPRPAALGAWRQELTNVAGEHLLGAVLVYLVIAAAGRISMPRRPVRPSGPATFRGFPVRRRGRTRFVEPAEIDWVAAEGPYARLHMGERSEVLRRPLSKLAGELEAWGFVRVHRSALVNLDRVREVESVGHGDGTLHLVDGSRVRLSRTHRSDFDRAMRAR